MGKKKGRVPLGFQANCSWLQRKVQSHSNLWERRQWPRKAESHPEIGEVKRHVPWLWHCWPSQGEVLLSTELGSGEPFCYPLTQFLEHLFHTLSGDNCWKSKVAFWKPWKSYVKGGRGGACPTLKNPASGSSPSVCRPVEKALSTAGCKQPEAKNAAKYYSGTAPKAFQGMKQMWQQMKQR